MNEISQDWKERAIEDLRVINSEEFVNDDGEMCHCIYSFSLDAVTFVDDAVIQLLKDRGIQELEELPDPLSEGE
ncbi:hypothetical protein [Argonema antarcticum]|uniref:hypothetical protein n=1 Tax=Argonema antarcticum TaxID=2942763 RepID=UPI0020135F73|nr:hypothetical protein [Argonema antarcticum]MCL1473183.1 hypothetical protein [Argonema antarcticum A004/B2]